MDLSTTYMGLNLKSPLILSSSGLTKELDNIKQASEMGIGAVVLKSLFEEEIIADRHSLYNKESMFFWYPEAIDYVDNMTKHHGVENYISLLKDAKSATDIPVIASINCVSPNVWPEFAQTLQNAGADAIELNIGILPTNDKLSAVEISKLYRDIIIEVKKYVDIPVAVKTGYYFTNLYQELTELSKTEIDGLVLFNRFYRPDIDIEHIKLISDNYLSAPEELNQSLRWIALLYGKVDCDLSASTGVHNHQGAIKQLLAGADSVQLCSAIYKYGIEHIKKMNDGLSEWMENKNFHKINDFKGMIARRNHDGGAFERIQYIRKSFDTRYKPVKSN